MSVHSGLGHGVGQLLVSLAFTSHHIPDSVKLAAYNKIQLISLKSLLNLITTPNKISL